MAEVSEELERAEAALRQALENERVAVAQARGLRRDVIEVTKSRGLVLQRLNALLGAAEAVVADPKDGLRVQRLMQVIATIRSTR